MDSADCSAEGRRMRIVEKTMAKRKIKYWAYWADVVSGVAVVVTLVFLIFEVRRNSDLVRADAFDRNIESLIELRMHIASNDRSLQAMAEHWGIDNPEFLRRQLLAVSLWSIYEKTFYAQNYGLVGEPEWERFETRICRYVGARSEFWHENIAPFLSAEFREFVTSRCADDVSLAQGPGDSDES